MFWINDFSELINKPTLIPTDYMTIEEKLNTLTRLIIFICVILALVLQDSKIILLMIILVIIIVVMYQFQKTKENEVDTFLDETNRKVVDSKICTKPTKNNPFMNPTILDMQQDQPACPLSDKNTIANVDQMYDNTMFRNADDIYDRTTSKRQFYTVPASSIPNDQATFANWLYNRGKSCKENNGDQCFNNMYTDIRRP
jgi:hypothetical protein